MTDPLESIDHICGHNVLVCKHVMYTGDGISMLQSICRLFPSPFGRKDILVSEDNKEIFSFMS